MSSALFGVAILGIFRVVIHPHHQNPLTDTFIFTGICYIFTILNYMSFLYMIETSAEKRKHAVGISLYALPVIIASMAIAYIWPSFAKTATIVNFGTCILVHFILLNLCLREYDKFMLLMNNYYSNYRNIRWVPFCLWFTFAVACITVISIYYKPAAVLAGATSLFIYTFISMKLLGFVPQYVHTARESINKHEIIAIEGTEENVQAIGHDKKEEKEEKEEKDANAERLEKRYEKVASLLEKWVESEKYTTPGLNIKDVATQIGTNSNYLSNYINNVLGTSFALWLNTLRIEKSKQYLSTEGRITMEECGIKVGYESLYNYSRWFKSVTGMSPSQWKRQNCG